MHIIVFPGWYPNRLDKLSGDFIQRHMQAIALKCKVTVVIPVKDKNIQHIERVEQSIGNLTEIFIYYPSFCPIESIDNIFSFIRYTAISFKTASIIHKKEKIDLVHLYVLQKNLLIGFLLKWLLKVPFVVSEQSTFYVDGGLEKAGWLLKKGYAYIFNKSKSVHAVSDYLLTNIFTKLGIKTKGVVIPNVVDTTMFCYSGKASSEPITFVHVSNMVHQKNVDGMLYAFNKVKKKGLNFKLNLVGPIPAYIQKLILELELDDRVVVWGPRKYEEVAEVMKQSDAFVFFTRYETFGCVIIEANACGLPVIVSDLAVTRELITNNINGLFVQNENVNDLADKFQQ